MSSPYSQMVVGFQWWCLSSDPLAIEKPLVISYVI